MDIMPPEPDQKTDPAERDPLWVAANATDPHWYDLTGCCGGCGRDGCHEGPCPGNASGYCLACPTRRETGEVRGER